LSSFTQKQLRVTLTLASENTVFNTNSNRLVLTGLRMSASIQGAARFQARADVTVFGMLKEDMNALTVIFGFKGTAICKNQIVVESNSGLGWREVFSGTISNAQPDYRGAPSNFFRIQALGVYFDQLAGAPSLSYSGDTDVASIAQTLAQGMSLKLENNGVNQSLSTPHFSGTLYEQLVKLSQDAGIDFYIQGGILAICPANSPRGGLPIVQLSSVSGLIGYPVLQPFGICLECLFDPALLGGGQVQVESELPNATGLWQVFQYTHHLESNKPGGAWLSQLNCLSPATGLSP
jgi:hypothetical protein